MFQGIENKDEYTKVAVIDKPFVRVIHTKGQSSKCQSLNLVGKVICFVDLMVDNLF